MSVSSSILLATFAVGLLFPRHLPKTSSGELRSAGAGKKSLSRLWTMSTNNSAGSRLMASSVFLEISSFIAGGALGSLATAAAVTGATSFSFCFSLDFWNSARACRLFLRDSLFRASFSVTFLAEDPPGAACVGLVCRRSFCGGLTADCRGLKHPWQWVLPAQFGQPRTAYKQSARLHFQAWAGAWGCASAAAESAAATALATIAS